jgi:hypothetical protein
VAVLGIDTDGDKAEFKKRCTEAGVVWPNIFEGSTGGKIPELFGGARLSDDLRARRQGRDPLQERARARR